VRRAKIVLMADEAQPEGGYSDRQIAEEVGLCERQVVRIRQKFAKSGVQPTLTRATRSDAGTRRVLDGKAEAIPNQVLTRRRTLGCFLPL
jgi:hypothetical protein